MKASDTIGIFLKNKERRNGIISETRKKIERFFEETSHLLYNNPLKTLIITFLFVGALGLQVPRMTIETSSESLLLEDDPVRIDYNLFRQHFERSGMIFIAIESSQVFSLDFLKKLKLFHKDLERETPHIQRVNSLINTKKINIEGTTLITENLFEKWPESQEALESLQHRITNDPVYINNIISENGRVTAIIIQTKDNIIAPEEGEGLKAYFEGDEEAGYQRRLTSGEISEIIIAVKKVADRYRDENFSIVISGGILIADVYNKFTLRDMRLCLTLGLITIAFFLALLFRRVSGVILPMIVINSSMFTVWGLMTVFQVPIRLTTTVLPAFLLAVSVGDSVHILSIFFKSFQQGKSKQDAIAHALSHSGLPVAMTSFTTAASLLSFSFAELSAVAEIGIFGAIGVLCALIFTIVMLPPLISLTPLKQKAHKNQKFKYMDTLLLFFANISTSYPKKIVVTSIILIFISIAFIFQLKMSHNQIEWFPDKIDVRKDIRFIDRELRGTIALEIIVDSKKKGGIFTNEILDGIEVFSKNIENIENEEVFVGKVFSINTFVKDLNRSFHKGDAAYYEIPRNLDKIPLDIFLSLNEVPDFVKRIVDSNFSKTRITIKTPWVDSSVFNRLIQTIKQEVGQAFPHNVDVTITGGMALVARAIPAAIHSMVKSYLLAFVVITVMMIILVGDFKIGILSMLPNLLPIVMVMGLMGLMRIPLDSVTIMIGSIAIGLVVDDTVHFLYNFQKYYDLKKNSYEAVRQTMLGTGRALLITSLVLSSGFFALLFASLKNMMRFGLFTGIAIALALLADFLLIPALMTLVIERRKLNSPRM